ncbi:MAG: DNA polymerase I, partial [Candidatus Nealsonbacteria bacterium]|nr:DNA polymerase I [Candidatus Nealsonbacteria bacterium]
MIGAIARKFSAKDNNFSEIIILSGDSDMLQLVEKNIKVCLIRTGVKDLVLYDKEKVKEKYQGLAPEQVADFKALKGDSTDNIPGVAGIGEKTAIELLLKFGNIKRLYEGIIKNDSEVNVLKPRIKELLAQGKENAFLSRELAEIKTDIPIKIHLNELAWKSYDKKTLVNFLQE